MEWFQFITLLATIIGSVFAFHKMTQEKIDEMKTQHREDSQKHDLEFKEIRQEMREETAKRDALWATLLEKIHIVEKQIYNLDKKFYKMGLDRSRK